MDAPGRSGGVLDLHAGERRQHPAAPQPQLADGEHAALAEAEQPHDHELDLPATVVGPRVHDLADHFPGAIQHSEAHEVMPGHVHVKWIVSPATRAHRVGTPFDIRPGPGA